MSRIRKMFVAELPAVQEAPLGLCCLYVIQEAKDLYFKIGVAGHPLRRLSALQCGNRRKLSLAAVYAGTKANCLYVEKVALRYFGAPAGSEWVSSEHADSITDFLDAFCEEET